MQIKKIISGGQTGVDRVALDIALDLGIPCGGWCPKGRKAEDGRIDSRYPLMETSSGTYRVRTGRNVRESDGTLVITRGKPREGTALTIKVAQKYGKPFLVVDLSLEKNPTTAERWMDTKGIQILNIAGPRESQTPGIYKEASQFLRAMFKDQKR